MPRRATEPQTAPLQAKTPPPPEPEPDPTGAVLAPVPVDRVELADGSTPDAATAFTRVAGNIWRCNVRLINVAHPPHLNGRAVRTLLTHPGQTVLVDEKDRLVALMRRH